MATEPTPAELETALGKAVSNTLRDMNLRETRRSASVTAGVKSITGEGASDDGRWGRVDVLYRNRKFYIFIAVVPKSLFPSEEVNRFFGSIKWLDSTK